jgi:hypothetical protein
LFAIRCGRVIADNIAYTNDVQGLRRFQKMLTEISAPKIKI